MNIGIPRDHPVLGEIVRRLVGAYEPDRIYLFGSTARGDSRADSDYDLMVVVPDDAPPERRRSRLAYQVLRGTGTGRRTSWCGLGRPSTARWTCRTSLSATIYSTAASAHIPVSPRAPGGDTRMVGEGPYSDLRAAETSLGRRRRCSTTTSSTAKQAAEKAMKGFLTWHGRPFRKTHSLEEIGEQCLRVDSTLRDLVDRAVPLTEYAWKFRYPGEPEGPAPVEADEAFVVARDVFAAILANTAGRDATVMPGSPSMGRRGLPATEKSAVALVGRFCKNVPGPRGSGRRQHWMRLRSYPRRGADALFDLRLREP